MLSYVNSQNTVKGFTVFCAGKAFCFTFLKFEIPVVGSTALPRRTTSIYGIFSVHSTALRTSEKESGITICNIVGAGCVLFITHATRRLRTRSYSTTKYLAKEFQNICMYATRRPCDEKCTYKYFETPWPNVF